MKNMVDIEKIASDIGVQQVFLYSFLKDSEVFSTKTIIDNTVYVSIEEAYNFIVSIHFGREILHQAMHNNQYHKINIDLNDDVMNELNNL